NPDTGERRVDVVAKLIGQWHRLLILSVKLWGSQEGSGGDGAMVRAWQPPLLLRFVEGVGPLLRRRLGSIPTEGVLRPEGPADKRWRLDGVTVMAPERRDDAESVHEITQQRC